LHSFFYEYLFIKSKLPVSFGVGVNKPLLRLKFLDFWPGFQPRVNHFIELLDDSFEIEHSEDPDVIFYSSFGRENENFSKPLRFFFTGENIRPNLFACDYALTFDQPLNTIRQYRWPLFNLYYDPARLPDQSHRERFCCMVVSNPINPLRVAIFDELTKFKRVDSGGKLLNNVGGPVPDKMLFIKQYRFCLAFENASWPGYTTEKLLEAKIAGCIPVYWGNPEIAKDFNSESFVNLHDFSTLEDCVKWIIEIDKNTELYEKMRSAPLLVDNEYGLSTDRQAVTAWIVERILQGTKYKQHRILSKVKSYLNSKQTNLYNQKALKIYLPRDFRI